MPLAEAFFYATILYINTVYLIMKSALSLLTSHPDIYLGNSSSSSQHKIERLPVGLKDLDCALKGGIPKAGLTRVRCRQGSGEFQLLAPVLEAVQSIGKKTVWIQHKYRINPLWLSKHRLLSHSWLVTPGSTNEALWTCEQCIRSQACSLIVYAHDTLNTKSARRLQVLSKQHQCLVLHIDYSLQPLPTLPVNVDFELFLKDDQWFITIHRVVGSWPLDNIMIPNPLPASNDAIIIAMRAHQPGSYNSISVS